MDGEHVDQNIVREIMRECRKFHMEENAEFLKFYVKLLRLDPKWKISGDIQQIRLDIQKFIGYIVNRLKSEDDPQISALKIQCHFQMYLKVLNDLPISHRKNLVAKLFPLQLSILEPPWAEKQDFLTLFRKIVNYVTLLSGLGNPKDIKVYREAETVLKSIWSPVELLEFYSVYYTTREETLQSLTKVSAGIRLFNMDCDKGGQGISQLPQLLFSAIDAVEEQVDTIKEEISKRIHLLSVTLDACFVPVRAKNKYLLSSQLPENATEKQLEYYVNLLIVYVQFSSSLRELTEELSKVKSDSSKASATYKETLTRLHQKIIPNIPESTSFVFPIFIHLFDTWCQFQDQTVILAGLKAIFEKQYNLINTLSYDDHFTMALVPPVEHPSSLVTLPELIGPFDKNVRVFKKEYLSYWRTVDLEYCGFCCWKLVSTNGLLSKGNLEYGIVLYKKKFYSFSSALGVQSFSIDPEFYTKGVLNLARKKMELIHLLNIISDMEEVADKKTLIKEEMVVVQTSTKKVQTDTHPPVPAKIDESYEWNVWQLKRKALHLVTLSRCATKYCGPEGAYNVNSKQTQTYDKKEHGVQTKSDNYSNTATPVRYFFGLRGRKDSNQFVLDVTDHEFRYRSKCI